MSDDLSNLDELVKPLEGLNEKINSMIAETLKAIDFSFVYDSFNESLRESMQSLTNVIRESLSNIPTDLYRSSIQSLANEFSESLEPLRKLAYETIKNINFDEIESIIQSTSLDEIEINFTDEEVELVQELDNRIELSNSSKLSKDTIRFLVSLLVSVLIFLYTYISDEASAKQREEIIQNQEEQLEETKKLESYENRVVNLLESISSQLEQSSQESS